MQGVSIGITHQAIYQICYFRLLILVLLKQKIGVFLISNSLSRMIQLYLLLNYLTTDYSIFSLVLFYCTQVFDELQMGSHIAKVLAVILQGETYRKELTAIFRLTSKLTLQHINFYFFSKNNYRLQNIIFQARPLFSKFGIWANFWISYVLFAGAWQIIPPCSQATKYSSLIMLFLLQIINKRLYNRLMMKIFLVLALTILGSWAAVKDDLITKVPGFGDDFNTSVYSGYLNTSSPSRRLHYVFVQSVKGANNSDPVTLWLNGGPGCSSLLGYLQQIGPYYLEEGKNYTAGDKLEKNPYSWHLESNLLFLQSPAGVGYSINTNQTFRYDDLSTMNDNFEALKNFFSLYPEYKNAKFWIAGESYAGKYIPDLAFRIDHFNLDPSTPVSSRIKLNGLFIGNGVIDFRGDQLFKSTVQYFIDHDFIDPQTIPYWTNACTHDQQSAGCQFFYTRFEQTLQQINPYNIYSYCYYNDSFAMQNKESEKRQFLSQQAILMKLAKASNSQQPHNNQRSKFNGAPCAYFDGLYQYFNTHYRQYHAEARATEKLKWNGPCAQDISAKYLIDQSGSTHQLQYLFNRLYDIHIVLYNGDWDGVVPFVDTIKNLQKMKIANPSLFAPIFYNDQHIGFNTIMSGINFVTIKGASHQVPQSKRPQSFYIFKTLLEAFPDQQIRFN